MAKKKPQNREQPEGVELRIIGGKYRGSKLRYHGDPQTRPMKERVREAIFNLISTESEARHAIDLFAGTGALGLEALSRGAARATFIEKHVPTARVVEENIAALDLQAQSALLTTSAFLWGKRDLPDGKLGFEDSKSNPVESEQGWLVFCSPPYAFYSERQNDMLQLIQRVMLAAPYGSIVVVEADENFDFQRLPGGIAEKKQRTGWRVREYPPAVIGLWRKVASEEDS